MKRIMKNKKGFTMAELLIVVAIIAVLVAIAIPVFTSQLEKSREATDIANIRSAYAAAQSAALTGVYGTSGTAIDSSKKYTYSISTGGLEESTDGTVTWFKGTTTGTNADEDIVGGLKYNRSKAYTKLLIEFTGSGDPYTVTITLN